MKTYLGRLLPSKGLTRTESERAEGYQSPTSSIPAKFRWRTAARPGPAHFENGLCMSLMRSRRVIERMCYTEIGGIERQCTAIASCSNGVLEFGVGHTCTCTVYVVVCASVRLHVCMLSNSTHTYIYIYTNINIYVYVYVYIHTCMYMAISPLYTCRDSSDMGMLLKCLEFQALSILAISQSQLKLMRGKSSTNT